MKFEDIQNKIFVDQKNERLLLVYSMDVVESINYSETKKTITIVCLDINSSHFMGDFVAEEFLVDSVDEFAERYDLFDLNKNRDYLQTILSSMLVLTDILKKLKQDFETCTNVLQSYRHAVEEFENNSPMSENTLMLVSLKDLEGNWVQLKEDEHSKIFEIVSSLVRKNVDIDTEDDKVMQDLKNQIELDIIEFLPDLYNDMNIQINMNLIKDQISKIQGDNDEQIT